MPAIITNKFRIHNQEQFVESFSESAANVYYLGIGRPQAFATSTRGDSRTDNEGTDSASTNTCRFNTERIYTFDDMWQQKKLQVQIFLLYSSKKLGNWYSLRLLQTRLW